MAFISFQAMTDELSENLRRQYRENLPFAVVVALTRTAIACRDRMAAHMRKAFRDPVPYTLGATRAAPATPASMSAAVYLRDFASKGTPAAKYLGAEINGGPRGQKRSERALAAIGILQSGGFVAPGAGARLDAHGQQSRGEIVQILSGLEAFGEQGYRANKRSAGRGAGKVGQIFAVRQGGNRPGLQPGIYRRLPGGKVTPLMKFISRPNYRVRLPFEALVETDAADIFPRQLTAALADFK